MKQSYEEKNYEKIIRNKLEIYKKKCREKVTEETIMKNK